jgi:hypothetical protein
LIALRREDAGDYRVVVSNDRGTAISSNIVLQLDTTFRKITDGDIVRDAAASKGAAWVDADNDGWIDLYVVNRFNQGNHLYRNLQNGQFASVTAGPLVSQAGDYDMSAWGDYDNDGTIDVVSTEIWVA